MEYEDDDLRRLAEELDYSPKAWGSDVIRAYRKKIQILRSSTDERDLRNLKSLHLEKLSGDRAGHHSIRLNGQFRLILRFRTDGEKIVVVLELVDYH